MDTKIRVSPEYFLLLLLTYTIFAEKIKYMRIDIITVLPEMIEGFFNCSIMKRAQNKGLAEIHIHNLRDYTEDKYRRVDDYPFGGFAGMVMKIEPIERCINALKAERPPTFCNPKWADNAQLVISQLAKTPLII